MLLAEQETMNQGWHHERGNEGWGRETQIDGE